MNKNFTLKCMALFAFTLMGFKAQAQYYADGTIATKDLKVDIDDGTDGTIGSWYRWNPNAGTTNTATYTAGDDPDGSELNDSNQATITWNPGAWPGSGGNPLDLIKDYKIIAEEFNSCQPSTSTEDSKTDIDVKLIKADVLKISKVGNTDICYIATVPPVVEIEILGTPEGAVNFTVTGGSVTTNSINFDVNGKAIVKVTSTGGDIELTIDKVVYTKTQPSGLNFEISTLGAGIAFNEGSPFTIKVGSAPKVSPIVF